MKPYFYHEFRSTSKNLFKIMIIATIFLQIMVIFAKTAQHTHEYNCNQSIDRLEANTMEVSFTPII